MIASPPPGFKGTRSHGTETDQMGSSSDAKVRSTMMPEKCLPSALAPRSWELLVTMVLLDRSCSGKQTGR